MLIIQLMSFPEMKSTLTAQLLIHPNYNVVRTKSNCVEVIECVVEVIITNLKLRWNFVIEHYEL